MRKHHTILFLKEFLTFNLTDPPLVTDQSKINLYFTRKMVNGHVKLRGKYLPQLSDSEHVPRPGIRLIKENTAFGGVGVEEVLAPINEYLKDTVDESALSGDLFQDEVEEDNLNEVNVREDFKKPTLHGFNISRFRS